MTYEDVLALIESDMSADAARQFTDVAVDYFNQSREPQRPVSTPLSPDRLTAQFAESPPFEAQDLTKVTEQIRAITNQSNWLYHPRYMGHQVSAPLPAAVWTDAVVSALNNSVAVQEMSPAITMIEHSLVRWMAGLLGLGASAGGTLTSGGTEATFTGLLAARAAALPRAWEDGVGADPPVILCGEHAHYAVTRAASELGLGLKQAISIRSKNYRMNVNHLRETIAKLGDRRIMAVVATAGSTATGSFDDLVAIADVCDEHGLWLHVDGAHGASAVLSGHKSHLLCGIERARSIAWDPHKMMLMPLSVGALLVRDQADLDAAFSQRAPYLFGQQTRSWDQGGRSFMCSRRGDALKLWAALNRYGTRAFGLLFDHLCEMAMVAHDEMKRRPDWEVLHEPQCNILCFRYNGSDELNSKLRAEYNTKGTGWITSTELGGRRVLRVTMINPRISPEDVAQMIEELELTAQRLKNG
jgi:L-2,4-diaminobutyrate decarboxylase